MHHYLIFLFLFFTDEDTESRRGENSGSPSWSVVQLATLATSPTSAFHTPPTQQSIELGKAAFAFYVKNFPWGKDRGKDSSFKQQCVSHHKITSEISRISKAKLNMILVCFGKLELFHLFKEFH